MNVYLLDDPAKPAEFARFSHVGTWSNDRVCEVCGEPTSRLVEPLQIEWDEGTDRIGDFSWGGYHCVADQFGRSRATFITEDALTKLTRAGFSNLCPRLAGRIES